MKRWLVILLSIFALITPGVAKAQDLAPQIEKMEIEILPEYDRPDVLVIYRITLASHLNLPAQLTVRIPKEAVQPYNVAMKDVDGQLYNLDYGVEMQGEWLIVTLTTPLPDVQIEYYDPRISREDGERRLAYTWPQDLTVRNLSLSVFQPVNATNLTTNPDMGSGRKTATNLTKYDMVLGEMTAASSFLLQISYDKPDEVLSGPSQPVLPAAPISDKTTGWVTLQELLPWMLGAVGLLLIGGGGFWYWRSGREFAAPRFRRRHDAPQTGQVLKANEQGVFCHKCGRRASSGDVFCRTCGTKLRLE